MEIGQTVGVNIGVHWSLLLLMWLIACLMLPNDWRYYIYGFSSTSPPSECLQFEALLESSSAKLCGLLDMSTMTGDY